MVSSSKVFFLINQSDLLATKIFILDFKDASSLILPTHSPLPSKWSATPPLPPKPGCFKINVDRASVEDGKGSSIGMISRDSHGTTIGAFNKLLPSTFTTEVIEALALHQGVLFVSEMNIPRAIFKSNAVSIIQALNSGNKEGEIGHILEDTRLAKLTFSWCMFQHLKRDGNKVALELAKEARISSHSRVWKGNNPSFVQQFLLNYLV